MPLIKSGSRKAIGQNIAEMEAAGHPRDQSIAAALSTARRYGKAEGGAVEALYEKLGSPYTVATRGQDRPPARNPLTFLDPRSGGAALGVPMWAALISDLAKRALPEESREPLQPQAVPLGRTMPMPHYRAPGGPVISKPDVPMSEADRVMPIRPDASWSERVIEPLNRRQYEMHDRNLLEPPMIGGQAPQFNMPVYDPYEKRPPMQDGERARGGRTGYQDGGTPEPSLGGFGKTLGHYLQVTAPRTPDGAPPIGYAGGGWAGEYDSEFTPEKVAPVERPRSPVPEWLIEQQKASSPFPGTTGNFLHYPFLGYQMAKELTGVPSILRGGANLTDPDADNWDRAKGIGQMAVGALPMFSAARATPVVEALAGTWPRMIGLSTLASDAPREATAIARELLGSGKAQAQSTKEWVPPSPEQKRNRSWVLQQQERLISKGLYPKDDKTLGSYGSATESALKREWADERRAEEKTQLERAGAEAETAKANQAIKEAEEREKTRIAGETADRIRKADIERLTKLMHDEAGYGTRMLRSAPEVVGALGAGVLGKGLGYGIGAMFGRPAANLQREANALLEPVTGRGKQLGEVANVNSFWTKGGSPAEPFLVNTKAVPPFKSNESPNVLPAGALYPAPQLKNQIPEMTIQGGIAAAPLYETVKAYTLLEPAEKELAAATQAFNADPTKVNYERYVNATDEVAKYKALMSAGVGYTAGHGGGTALSMYTRGHPQPDVARGAATRLRLEESLGKNALVKAEKAEAAAKAEKAAAATKRRRAQARKAREASQEATPKKPNGGAGALLLPLGASLLEEGSQPRQPEGLGAQPLGASALGGDSSYFNSYDEPFATGGHVEEEVKHHSFYQPRKVGRFAGGPVGYPKAVYPKASFAVRQPPRQERAEGGPAVLPEGWQDMAHPGYEAPVGPPKSPEAARIDEILDAARHSGFLGGLGGPFLGRGISKDPKSMNTLAPRAPADPVANPTRMEDWYGFRAGGTVPQSAGPVHGTGGGRADDLDMNVASGSFVLPADVVSGLPGAGGNTNAGMTMLERQFGRSEPHGAMAGGGVPIKISAGEFVLSPEQVARVGGGDVRQGHRVLEHFVKKCRANHVATLSKLPGPAK